jgi:hypothetical protein
MSATQATRHFLQLTIQLPRFQPSFNISRCRRRHIALIVKRLKVFLVARFDVSPIAREALALARHAVGLFSGQRRRCLGLIDVGGVTGPAVRGETNWCGAFNLKETLTRCCNLAFDTVERGTESIARLMEKLTTLSLGISRGGERRIAWSDGSPFHLVIR